MVIPLFNVFRSQFMIYLEERIDHFFVVFEHLRLQQFCELYVLSDDSTTHLEYFLEGIYVLQIQRGVIHYDLEFLPILKGEHAFISTFAVLSDLR